MAAVDRERARRLVETLERPRDQALALGAMAQSLADTDKKAASAMLDEAFRRLEKLAREGGDADKAWACVAAGHLLPTAEKLDPELLRRGFWRAVALRPPRPAGGDPTGGYDEAIADLAIVLARYDRAVARQVLEPAAARARSLVERSRAFRGHDLFAAADGDRPGLGRRPGRRPARRHPGQPGCTQGHHPPGHRRRARLHTDPSAGTTSTRTISASPAIPGTPRIEGRWPEGSRGRRSVLKEHPTIPEGFS